MYFINAHTMLSRFFWKGVNCAIDIMEKIAWIGRASVEKKTLNLGDSPDIHAQRLVSILAWISTAGAGMLQFSKQQTGVFFLSSFLGANYQLFISAYHISLKKFFLKAVPAVTNNCLLYEQVDKLKVLSESLASSTSKGEKRITDHRYKVNLKYIYADKMAGPFSLIAKEEALKVRVVKADEANEKEKEIVAEVNASLAVANARLHDAREERDQFDEANNQIVEHLKTKEDEVSKTIAACKVEAAVLSTWLNFLEDTWLLQQSHTEAKEKQLNDELERHEDYFVKLAIHLLSEYKKELEPSISRIEKFVENLKNLSGGLEMASSADNEDSKELNPRKNLEEEYLDYEAKIITTFSVVDNMREQFYAQKGESSRKDDTTVKELFDEIEKLRVEFESIERPNLELEIPTPKADSTSEKPLGSPSHISTQNATTLKSNIDEHPKAPAVEADEVLDPAAELAKLESEFGKDARDYSTEEIGGWEFDELERELRSGDTATNS
ncbi:hypothetical protein POTOM_038766 [Populus tomentosa]|uniref:Uncharacterized protein n=1 Tax=Populus tomentosa TaxID=118781 RepID=A0A8X8CLG6_POPTO|nr:hypothetical protein POTOM_038766 [Populus tomentosa]